MLISDECMKKLFQDGNGVVVQACSKWLSSRNNHLEISGALALGNFARSGIVSWLLHCIMCPVLLIIL